MNIKQITFDLLDQMKTGEVFKTVDLTRQVNSRTGRRTWPDTILRYIREYRESRPIENISKAKSIYKVAG